MGEPSLPTRAALRPFAALGVSAFALGLLLSWAFLAGGRRLDFFLLLPILGLALCAPRWRGGWHGGERTLRGGTGVLAALILGLTLLRQPRPEDVALTIPLWLIVVSGVTVVLHATLPPRVALGAILTMLAVLAGLGQAFGADAAQALGAALRTGTPWGLLIIVAVGVLILARVERRWVQLIAYAIALAALAIFWQWGGPLDSLARVRGGLQPLEIRAGQLVPTFIIIGGVAQLLLALLLPRGDWRGTARRDLAALLLLCGVPLVADLLPLRRPLYFENDFRVAWLALFLVALVFARSAIAVRFLLRSADAPSGPAITPRARETRLALAFVVVCFAAYWPATLWRAASYGMVGDEPSYLAATMSLWNERNLELANSMFAPQMTAVLADPQGERELHVYEDGSADRMLFSRNLGTPRVDLYLPLVAAPGMTSAIALINPDRESAGGEIIFRDGGGAVVEKRPILIASQQSLLLTPPAAPNGPLSASIKVGKPIGTAVRLTVPGAGTETYFGAAVTPRHCLPFTLDPARWQAEALIQNGFPTETIVDWTRYDTGGQALAKGKVTIPADGVATLPADLTGGTGTLCLAADGPVAAALVARATPGLLVVQSAPAAARRIDIPDRHMTLGYQGQRTVVVHNPSDSEIVTLTVDREGGPRGQQVEVMPRGTWSYAISADQATLTAQGSVMVSILETIGGHATSVTPEGTAVASSIVPTIDIGRDGYAVSQIELTNAGTEPVQATLNLTDGRGRTLWSDKIWVEANGTTSKPFWYKGEDSRFLTIEARTPLTTLLLQREIRSAGPVHGLGLSLALLPGYALGGYDGVLITVALLAALVALAIYQLLRRVGLDPRAAILVAALVGCSSPLSPAVVRLYAEVGGTLFILLALLCIDNWRTGRWSAHVAAPLAALCLGGVVLFHARLFPAALVVAGMGVLAGLWRLLGAGTRRSPRRWALAIGGALAGLLGLVVAVAMASRFEPRLRPEYLDSFIRTSIVGPQSFGILFDRASGLFPAAPFFLLAGGGFVWLIRRAPFFGWTALAVATVQFAVIAVRAGGWETWGPPGRYIYPAVPFWALAFGAAWCWGFARPVRWLAGILAAFGLAVTAFSWWLPLGLHYGFFAGSSYWFTDAVLPPLLGTNPFRLFPALPSNSSPAWMAVVPWVLLLVIGGFFSLRWWRKEAFPGLTDELSGATESPLQAEEHLVGDGALLIGTRERTHSE